MTDSRKQAILKELRKIPGVGKVIAQDFVWTWVSFHRRPEGPRSGKNVPTSTAPEGHEGRPLHALCVSLHRILRFQRRTRPRAAEKVQLKDAK